MLVEVKFRPSEVLGKSRVRFLVSPPGHVYEKVLSYETCQHEATCFSELGARLTIG